VNISVIICTRNRAAALDATLNALKQSERPDGMDVEILVIDNGSTDATSEVVALHRVFERAVTYHSEKRTGKSQALNTGLALSKGQIVVLTDDDVRPSPGWLIELSKPILAGCCDAVSGSVLLAPHLVRAWMNPLHRAWLAATDYLDASRPETAVGANMAFHRRVLSRVPGFDPELGPGKLGLWEDTLFSLQLRTAGYRLRQAPSAQVEHHFDAKRLERRAFLQRARAEGRSSAYVAWHWRHELREASRRNIVRWYGHLLAKRITRWAQWRQTEGMPEWEINLITGIEFERHYLRLRREPHLYEKLGLQRPLP